MFYRQHDRVQLTCKDRSRTKKEFVNDVNINNIIAKFKRDGTHPAFEKPSGFYVDLIDQPSYEEAMNRVVQAKNAFEDLPADLRERFNNSPEKFLDFIHDSKNHDELVNMGIAKPVEQPVEPPKAQAGGAKNKKPEEGSEEPPQAE